MRKRNARKEHVFIEFMMFFIEKMTARKNTKKTIKLTSGLQKSPHHL